MSLLPREAIGPYGPIAPRGGTMPAFIRKPVATCDFPVGGGGNLDPPMTDNMSFYCVKLNILT